MIVNNEHAGINNNKAACHKIMAHSATPIVLKYYNNARMMTCISLYIYTLY